MKTITLNPFGEKVNVNTESTLLETMLAKQCDVLMACGGQGICATCHVYVKEGADALSPMSSREERTLGLVSGSNSHSRLACQAKVLGEGVVVELPEGMYIQSANDLMSFVGKRAETPILHPKDGRILINKGKIITKSRILELESENFDVTSLRSS